MTPILAVESICKSFGKRVILNSAGVWAIPGKITVILGRNGCGKTTLMRIACGLLKPDYGVVVYRGERLTNPRLWQLARRGLFFLPERNLLHDGLTCGDHLNAVAYHHRVTGLGDVVEKLRVGDLLSRKPRQMSGGEVRRVELAVTLTRQPQCLIADEPFLGIAPRDAELLQLVFRELAASGAAVILTGHEVRSLLELADDVIWHTAGTTHALGGPEQARQHHQFGKEYLDRALPN
jgi:lipopolysaccharide export system ATP-binding protein